ncbi:MAG: threonyl-tRNA synthetase editing domain-containing protein, partial [Candidatus Hodarchaeales archaeon]
MQLLLIHSHGFEWKVTEKAIKDIESTKEVKLNYKTSESVLITFISIEESDISDIDHIIEQAGMEIKSALKDVGEKHLILYP